MQEMKCAVCQCDAPYRVKYAQNFTASDLNFDARKTPTHTHFRILQCKVCDLTYSSPILAISEIEQQYREAKYLSEIQIENMLSDYLYEFRKAMRLSDANNDLLEVGCANGFFLKKAQEFGFSNVAGVEPSREAVEKSHPDVKPFIINDFFHAELFDEESFDVICVIQIFDHAIDPNDILQGAYKLLRPGGLLFAINHNVDSWLPTVLGRMSPMYDVQHIYLFSLPTMRKLLENNKFQVEYVRNMTSTYNLSYALKMFPLPAFAEAAGRAILRSVSLHDTNVRLPAGNMVSVARKI